MRPISGIVGLLGFERSWAERYAISFYGVRGTGTFYYLSYALNHAPFRSPDLVWALAGLVVLVSVVVHGVTATPVVEEWLGKRAPRSKLGCRPSPPFTGDELRGDLGSTST